MTLPQTLTIKRALLSCHDKTGLEGFAKRLSELGVELIASGKTAAHLQKHGLRVMSVEAFTGAGEQLDGRVKTLHPKIHAGILAVRDQAAHRETVGEAGLIDLVVVNLYPFAQTIARFGVELADAIEQIDIGGVALMRAGAKNFSSVAVVCDPRQYDAIAEQLKAGKGALAVSLSRSLSVKAFRITSAYDALIARFLDSEPEQTQSDTDSVEVRVQQSLRYGENPHQKAGWYVPVASREWALGTIRQLQGKELSYNNFLDVDAALRCLLDFKDPSCVIIKHASQCGLASAGSMLDAYAKAQACDPESAFGGIVGLNRPLDAPLAKRLCETFLEVVITPSIAPDAAEEFKKKRNLRVITLMWPEHIPEKQEWRQLLGGWLIQERDAPLLGEEPRVVTQKAPSDAQRQDLFFAWTSAKHVRSNGIVLARELATVGIGQGQPSRVGSVRVALEKAGARSQDAVAASDGFFPFADNIEVLSKAGVRAVIQPGGSVRDPEVIAAADKAGMVMLFTGVRHFRH